MCERWSCLQSQSYIYNWVTVIRVFTPIFCNRYNVDPAWELNHVHHHSNARATVSQLVRAYLTEISKTKVQVQAGSHCYFSKQSTALMTKIGISSSHYCKKVAWICIYVGSLIPRLVLSLYIVEEFGGMASFGAAKASNWKPSIECSNSREAQVI